MLGVPGGVTGGSGVAPRMAAPPCAWLRTSASTNTSATSRAAQRGRAPQPAPAPARPSSRACARSGSARRTPRSCRQTSRRGPPCSPAPSRPGVRRESQIVPRCPDRVGVPGYERDLAGIVSVPMIPAFCFLLAVCLASRVAKWSLPVRAEAAKILYHTSFPSTRRGAHGVTLTERHRSSPRLRTRATASGSSIHVRPRGVNSSRAEASKPQRTARSRGAATQDSTKIARGIRMVTR